MAARLAPAVFVLLWSTGFIGAKYGLPYAEPFTLLGIRLAIAGLLLAGIAALARAPAPRGRAAYGHAALVGLLLHAGYLGGVFWAIADGLPAGTAALVVSLQPVLTAFLAAWLLGERVSARQWAGLLLGVAGVALVVAGRLSGPESSRAGLLACGLALAATTVGTLHQKRFGASVPLLSGTAVQYAAASAALLTLAVLLETRQVRWTPELLAAMAWLVVVLSLGAVLLLLVLLRRGSAAGVTALFYLVPPVTALQGALLFDERLDTPAIVGILVAALGVALVVTPPRTPARAPAPAG